MLSPRTEYLSGRVEAEVCHQGHLQSIDRVPPGYQEDGGGQGCVSRLERWVNSSWEGGMVCWFVDSCTGNTHRNSSNRVLLKTRVCSDST